jgi:hypothetical protein
MMSATIKEATRNAMDFARDALGPERTQAMRLEEVESGTEDVQRVWYITLSMLSPPEPDQSAFAASISAALSPYVKRDYKRFTVLKDTGEVTSMRIRELSTV